MNKKTLMMVGAGVIVLVLAGTAIFTALKLQEAGTESVAPNAPQSKPKAQSAPTGNPLQLSFNVTSGAPTPTGAATPTPSSGATATPTPTGAATPTPSSGATATPTPSATSSGNSSSSGSSAGTGSSPSDTLPEAGLEGPTLLMIAGGGLLLLAGIVLAL